MSIPRKNLSECLLNLKLSIDFSHRETFKIIYREKYYETIFFVVNLEKFRNVKFWVGNCPNQNCLTQSFKFNSEYYVKIAILTNKTNSAKSKKVL